MPLDQQKSPTHNKIRKLVNISTNAEILAIAKTIVVGCFSEIAKLPPQQEITFSEESFEQMEVSFAIKGEKEDTRIFEIQNEEEFSYIINRVPIYFSQIYFKPNLEKSEGIFYIFPNNYESKEINLNTETTVVVMLASLEFDKQAQKLVINKTKPRIFDIISDKALTKILQGPAEDLNSRKIKGQIGILEFLEEFESINSESLEEYWAKEDQIREKSRNLTDINELTQQLVNNINHREKNFTHAAAKVFENTLKQPQLTDEHKIKAYEEVVAIYLRYKSDLSFYKNAYKKLSQGEVVEIYTSSMNSAIDK